MEPDPKQFLAVDYGGYHVRKLCRVGTSIVIYKPAELSVDAFRKLAIMYLAACEDVDTRVMEQAKLDESTSVFQEDKDHDDPTQH